MVSTQGLGTISVDNYQKPKLSKKEKIEQKQRQNRYTLYIKNKKTIKKYEQIQLKKQKELEYLEKRLEIKKQRLEELTSKELKGEKEWKNY